MSYYYHKRSAVSRPPKRPSHVRTHFLRRLKERYEIELTMQDCKDLEKRRTGYALHCVSPTRRWYLMRINEWWVYCLHQEKFGFTTALTPQQFWASNPGLRLRMFREDSKFAEAWQVAREDQKKYQPKIRRIRSGPRPSAGDDPSVAVSL